MAALSIKYGEFVLLQSFVIPIVYNISMKAELLADIKRIQYNASVNNTNQIVAWDQQLVEWYTEKGYPFVKIPDDTLAEDEEVAFQKAFGQLAELCPHYLPHEREVSTKVNSTAMTRERLFENAMCTIALGIGTGFLGLALSSPAIAQKIVDRSQNDPQMSAAVVLAERIAQHASGDTYSEDLLRKLKELYGKEGVDNIQAFTTDLQEHFGIEHTVLKDEVLKPSFLGDPVAAAYVQLNSIAIDSQDFKNGTYSLEFFLQVLVHEHFHLVSKRYDGDYEEVIELPDSGQYVTSVRSGALQVTDPEGSHVQRIGSSILNEGLTHSQTLRMLPELGFENADIAEFMMITWNYSSIAQFLDRVFEDPTYDYNDLFTQISERKGSAVNGRDIELLFSLLEEIYDGLLPVEDAIQTYDIYYEILNITEKNRAAMLQ